MFGLKTTPVCAYCGKLWPKHKGGTKDIPNEVAEEVKKHVQVCEKNPLVQKNKNLQTELDRIIEDGITLEVQNRIRDFVIDKTF